MKTYLAFVSVFIGGGIGATLRYYMSTLLREQGLMPSKIHWTTFLINLFASILLVFVMKWTAGKPQAQLLFATGICGGWSTFSTFSLETVILLQQGKWVEALSYVLLSVLVSVLVVWGLYVKLQLSTSL
ncbi:MAG: fluoride efflux transporter CrcB [Flavobacteriales bacterium]|jgi:CrcB protein|tara:strand:- start:363 stop:749 length:387 start_codon:yes stop_codon:yes gene_type:complete